MEKDKSMHVAAIVAGLLLLLSVPAMAGFTPISQPDSGYTGSTINLMAGITAPDGTLYSGLSGPGMVVSFDRTLTLATVLAGGGGTWGTWNNPPYVESSHPRVLWTGYSELTMTLSAPRAYSVSSWSL